MRRTSRIAVGAAAAAAIAVGAAVVLGVGLPTTRDTHPPCEQLPTIAAATAALARNQPLADDIEALGDGISVRVGTPCPAGQDRALIEVAYRQRSQRDAIASLLARRDGFGVPVHLSRQ